MGLFASVTARGGWRASWPGPFVDGHQRLFGGGAFFCAGV